MPGRSSVLYVLDPGPDGSIGDTDWIIAARQAGKISTLIVQGVLHTPLAEAADIVAARDRAFVEKDATYTNMTGHVQAVIARDHASGRCRRRLADPDEARRGVRLDGQLRVGGRRPRRDRARAGRRAGLRGARDVTFARPVSARHWLQASNPSERWKWDFMFQDLPPIKFGEDFGPLPRADVIPLKEVK